MKAIFIAKFGRAMRAVIALVLISSFATSFAQAPADTREARLALAAKEVKEALGLARTNETQSAKLAITKLQTAESIYMELGEKARLLGVLFFLGHLQLATQPPRVRPNPTPANAAPPRPQNTPEPPMDPELSIPGVATLHRALDLARELYNTEQQIRIYGRLGEFYYSSRDVSVEDKRRARNYLTEAAKLVDALAVKPLPLSYDVYETLGKVWMALYNPPNATKAFLSAYRLVKDKPPEESIPAIIKFAKTQIDLGFPKYAVAPLEDARKKAIAAKLPELEALATWCIGDLMAGKFRDLPNAKRYLERTEQLLAADPDEALAAKLNLSWGKYYFAAFDVVKSADYFKKALNPAARTTPEGLKGEVMLYFGILNYTIGLYEPAITLLEEAAKVNGAENRKLMEMESLRYLARTYNAQGKENEARATLAKAMTARADSGAGLYSSESIAILIDDAELSLDSIRNLPRDARVVSAWLAKDRSGLTLALNNAKREGMPDLQSMAARRLAEVYSLLGDNEKAIGLMNESLVVARTAGLSVQEAGALTGLSDLSIQLGNSGAAAFYGKNAVNVYQQLRKRISDLPPEIRASYLKTIEGTYRKLVALLIEQGRIAEAEQVLTMLKQEELMEYVRRDDSVAKNMLQTLSLTETERTAITRYDAIAEQITSLGKELDALEKERRASTDDPFPKQQRYDEVTRLIADASLTFQKFLEGLKITFGQKDTRVTEVASGLQAMMDGLEEPRTVAVSTIVGEDVLNIIVTTGKTQRAHTVKIKAGEINDLVAKFYDALKSPQLDPRPAGQKLYDVIVKPIEADLTGMKADKILWSFDGSLRYIPPAALWDKDKGYMVERFANVMLNLAARTNINTANSKPEDRTVLGVGVSKAAEGFSALTAVPDELDCIVSDKVVGFLSLKPQCASGVLRGKKLLDEKFTLTSFRDQLGRYPIVHIASHFKLTPGDDNNSFLLLGGGDDRKYTVDKLRGAALKGVDLIVFSACDTATPGGLKTNGIEIEGFGSAAQESGAKAVMATLWPVADSSTKDFMVEFYKLYGKDGLSKADAMRKAQLALMYGKYSADEAQKHRADEFVTATDKSLPKFTPDPNAPFAHPFFWSPFVLTGNWR